MDQPQPATYNEKEHHQPAEGYPPPPPSYPPPQQHQSQYGDPAYGGPPQQQGYPVGPQQPGYPVGPQQPGYPGHNSTIVVQPGMQGGPIYAISQQPYQPGQPFPSGPQQFVVVQPPYDPELEKMRSAALGLSITAIFCGCLLCLWIPALVFAARKPPYGTRYHYRTAIILASISIALGIIWIIIVAVRGSMASSVTCYSSPPFGYSCYKYGYNCYVCN